MPLFRIGNQLSISLGLLIGSALSAEAHVGSLVVPFAEVTDEMLSEIQLDGSVDEWSDLIGEPAMTLLDFQPEGKEGGSVDPSDIDFQIWLAWHDEPARLYVAFVAADDRYWNTHTYDVDWITSDDDNMMRTWEGGNDGRPAALSLESTETTAAVPGLKDHSSLKNSWKAVGRLSYIMPFPVPPVDRSWMTRGHRQYSSIWLI